MTRKHFKAIANAIKENTTRSKTIRFNDSKLYKHSLIDDLSIVFKELNPRFNKQTFVNACNDNL